MVQTETRSIDERPIISDEKLLVDPIEVARQRELAQYNEVVAGHLRDLKLGMETSFDESQTSSQLRAKHEMIKKLEGCFNSTRDLVPTDAVQAYLLNGDPTYEFLTGDSRVSQAQQLAAADPDKYRQLKEMLMLSQSDAGTESMIDKYPIVDSDCGPETFGGGEKPPKVINNTKIDVENITKSGMTLLPDGGLKLSVASVENHNHLQLPEERQSATKDALLSSQQLLYSNMTSSHMQAVKQSGPKISLKGSRLQGPLADAQSSMVFTSSARSPDQRNRLMTASQRSLLSQQQ